MSVDQEQLVKIRAMLENLEAQVESDVPMVLFRRKAYQEPNWMRYAYMGADNPREMAREANDYVEKHRFEYSVDGEVWIPVPKSSTVPLVK